MNRTRRNKCTTEDTEGTEKNKSKKREVKSEKSKEKRKKRVYGREMYTCRLAVVMVVNGNRTAVGLFGAGSLLAVTLGLGGG